MPADVCYTVVIAPAETRLALILPGVSVKGIVENDLRIGTFPFLGKMGAEVFCPLARIPAHPSRVQSRRSRVSGDQPYILLLQSGVEYGLQPALKLFPLFASLLAPMYP